MKRGKVVTSPRCGARSCEDRGGATSKIGLCALMLSVALSTFGCCKPPGASLKPGVTATAIRAIALGMTRAEAERILGTPLGQVTNSPNETVVRYDTAEPKPPMCGCLTLRITFVSGRVESVGAGYHHAYQWDNKYVRSASPEWDGRRPDEAKDFSELFSR